MQFTKSSSKGAYHKMNTKLLSTYLLCLLIPACINTTQNPFEKPYKVNYSSPAFVYTEGTSIAADTPVVLGEKPVMFKIAPELPAGLVFDTSSGCISGTPQDTLTQTTFTITATNQYGVLVTPVTISIVTGYCTLATQAINGSITVSPNKTQYRMGETVSLTAMPQDGYEFTNWTGSLASSANPLSIIIAANKSLTAHFARVSETQCNTVQAGASVNQKIKDMSALPGGSTICPDQGAYDNNTIEIAGKVTIQVKTSY